MSKNNNKKNNFTETIFGHRLNQDTKYSNLLKRIIEVGFIITIIASLVSIFFQKELFARNILNFILTLILLAIYVVTKHLYKKKFNHIPTIYYYGAMMFGFLSYVLGEVYDFYELFPWWDNVLHFSSGVLIGSAVIIVVDYYLSKLYIRKNIWQDAVFTIIIASAASISIAVFWEFFEYSYDFYFGGNMQDGFIWGPDLTLAEVQSHILPSGRFMDKALQDTLFDQFLATTGAILSATINYYIFAWNRKNKVYDEHIEFDKLAEMPKDDLVKIIKELSQEKNKAD
ncbi:hypothetical protein RZE82_09525 [Mollicutes bacterium LVI A0039]|nr:hypothetical protein RZE82_09525 [Mollicutes bacterium LVI A0039]